MPLEELLDWLNAKPFTPFRITLSNGKAYDVLNPNQMWPGQDSTTYDYPDQNNEESRPFVTIGMMHINTIEPIEQAA